MSKASIVLGLMFGDEGKGISVDYLCSQPGNRSKLVVRFSGGQQVGHNVHFNGISHVCSNFGSGTLRNIPTYFSEHCTMYPVTMYNESLILSKKGITPEIYFHPLTRVTTPFDVVYNRMRKTSHGTCGLGIGATMHRNIKTGYKLYAIDLLYSDTLNAKLTNIFEYYKEKFEFFERVKFIQECNKELSAFWHAVDCLEFNIKPYSFLLDYQELIFEGSQGILLDMDHGIFPNVTYSNTTSKNALNICKLLHIKNVNIFYVTRCYQTRHGAGWMSNNKEITLVNNCCEINKFNDWQKDFRIGEIDYNLLNYALEVDNIYSGKFNKNLIVTCMDQRPDFEFNYSTLKVGFKSIFESYSPESKDFINVTNLIPKVDIYVCDACGSSDVESVAWVRTNDNNRYTDDFGEFGDRTYSFCNVCAAPTNLINKREFLNK